MKENHLKFEDKHPDFETALRATRNSTVPLGLLLDGIADVKNLGALFRIADAANLSGMYGIGMESMLHHKKLQRVARSTNRFIPFHHLPNREAIRSLKTRNQFIALEITDQSIPYDQFTPNSDCLLMVGNEVSGVSPDLLELADVSIHIPMYGINNSMNVAVATGIAVFHLVKSMINE